MNPLAEILPPFVAVEAGPIAQLAATPADDFGPLPEGASEGRSTEFKAGRSAAAGALQQVGAKTHEVKRGSSGEPIWPSGFVGSITHKGDFAACAVATCNDLSAIGIDAEHNRPVRKIALPRIASTTEQTQINQLASTVPTIHWDRLLFSAKESVAKAVAQICHELAGLDQIAVKFIDDQGGFVGTCDLHPALPLLGRWIQSDEMLFTAVVVTPRDLACAMAP